MEPELVSRWIAENLSGVVHRRSWGEATWSYNPGALFHSGEHFLTVKDANGPHDSAAALRYEGAWRLEVGVSRGAFEDLFGAPPSRPVDDGVIDGPWDFTVPNRVTPHPIYGWKSWIAVLNPTAQTFEKLTPMIVQAHTKARRSYEARLRANDAAA